MSIPNRRGPRALSEILGELFTVRGYGRLWARHELEAAWTAAVGEPLCRQTQLGEVRRGVLNVTVAHPALLEELAAFRKPALLEALRLGVPSTAIHDIRFRVGVVEPCLEASPAGAGPGRAAAAPGEAGPEAGPGPRPAPPPRRARPRAGRDSGSEAP
jgi:hypothetical protein